MGAVVFATLVERSASLMRAFLCVRVGYAQCSCIPMPK